MPPTKTASITSTVFAAKYHLQRQASDITNYAERRIIGSPKSVAQRIQGYIDAGVTHFAALMFAGNSLEDTKEQMHCFAEECDALF